MLDVNKDDEDILKNLILDKQKARLEQEYSEHKMEEALDEDIENKQVKEQLSMKLERAQGLQEELDKIIDWIPTEKFEREEVLEELIEEKKEEYVKQLLYEDYNEHRMEEAEEEDMKEQWGDNKERAVSLQEELENMLDFFQE